MYPTVSLSWELVSGIHKISDTFRIITGMGGFSEGIPELRHCTVKET